MKIDRLISIITLLLDHRRISAQALADRFEVSLRTIYRDLDAIGRAGIPIRAIPGANGGYEIMPQYKADKKTFSAEELAALLTGLSGLSGVVGSQELVHAFTKLNSMIPPEHAQEIRGRAGRFLFDRSTWAGTPQTDAVFEIFRTALDTGRPVAFAYISTKSRASSRVVEPYRLVLKGASWYLYGFCRERQAFRLFRLSRIQEPVILDESLPPRDYVEPELEFGDTLASLQTDILLRIHPSILDRVLDCCPYDRISYEGGHCLVRFPFIENDYYYDMLLSFGSRCECLKPERVRAELKRRIRELAELYGCD